MSEDMACFNAHLQTANRWLQQVHLYFLRMSKSLQLDKTGQCVLRPWKHATSYQGWHQLHACSCWWSKRFSWCQHPVSHHSTRLGTIQTYLTISCQASSKLELYVVNRWFEKFPLETALCSLTLSSVLYSITSNIYHFIQLSIIGKSVCTLT